MQLEKKYWKISGIRPRLKIWSLKHETKEIEKKIKVGKERKGYEGPNKKGGIQFQMNRKRRKKQIYLYIYIYIRTVSS